VISTFKEPICHHKSFGIRKHYSYFGIYKFIKLIAMVTSVKPVVENKIINKIYLVRDFKVMLDFDLAELYMVETKQLKRQVRRNMDRFPEDFMFELNKEEYDSLRSQFDTLKRGEHSKYFPMAFTEQGVAMLSSMLSSKMAIEVSR
jgi:hypothetical protein